MTKAIAAAALCSLFLAVSARAVPMDAIWLVSNGFHTSLGFRTRDLAFSHEITGNSKAEFVLIGWGATDFYEGKTNPWTFLEALMGIGGSVLHVVPVKEPISTRFSHSDVIELKLPHSDLRRLSGMLDKAFARDALDRRILIRRGYYADSRFYLGRERFYFPNMCNTWVAAKLHGSGLPISPANSLMAFQLMGQAAKIGLRERRLGNPKDAY